MWPSASHPAGWHPPSAMHLKEMASAIWRERPGTVGAVGVRAYRAARKIPHRDWSRAERGVRDRSG